LAVVFHDGLPRHPTQIYESLFHFSMAMVLFVLAHKNKLPTHRLQFYLIAYCVFRFFTEYIRPEPPWFLGWTFYQWTAVAMALGLAGQWAWDERRRRPVLLFPRKTHSLISARF
jgi:phosphatidylglycerol:prolipoprotein diacylglycerol transferase